MSKGIDLYEDKHWPKLISVLASMVQAAKANGCNAVSIDVEDILESVLTLPATVDLTMEQIESMKTHEQLLKFQKKGKDVHDLKINLAEVIGDTLTLNNFIAANGEWMISEYESPTYYLIEVAALKIHKV